MSTLATQEQYDVLERKAQLPAEEWLPPEEYNFDHFRTEHLMHDVRGTIQRRGIAPGERAPDFALPSATGGVVRLSNLRDKPVLLHFGSYT